MIAMNCCSSAGEVFDAIGPGGDIDRDGFADGLAGVGHLKRSDLVVTLAQQLHRSVEHTAALRA
ncbi:unannotated protein [freshwater metagenome]|uniref:Unannotated protein n=1 Tax=freshwater metagenome TaxID=449393 RepID=A0A6J6YCK7_9ZZZZ